MNISKRQNQPTSLDQLPTELWQGLWIVATPIGNLKDLSFRAKQVMETVDWILCEDTRRTAILFAALGFDQIIFKLKRLDAHSKPHEIEHWIQELRDGKNIALMTDAGTPAISDPGSSLVAQAHKNNIRVIPVPGPSAVAALMSVTGFSETSFMFLGFFPRSQGDQERILEKIQNLEFCRSFIWFESPFRILNTLEFIASKIPQAHLVVGKELTKLYENVISGVAIEVVEKTKEIVLKVGPIGEWCFAVSLPKYNLDINHNSNQDNRNEGWVKALECLSQTGSSLPDSVKLVSQQFGISKKKVYEAALHIYGKKNKQKS